MLNVEVVHMKNYGKVSKKLAEGSYYFYCGRPSRLGNPYWMSNESQRVIVIDQCNCDEEWHKEVDEFIKWIDAHNVDDLKLGCFCAPKICHCDIIKREIEAKCK